MSDDRTDDETLQDLIARARATRAEYVELLKRRARGEKVVFAADAEDMPRPTVVSLKTRKAYVPPAAAAKPRGKIAKRANRLLIEELTMLLQRAQDAEITTMSYVAINRASGECDAFAVLDDKQRDDVQAVRQLGALEVLKAELLDVAVGLDDLSDEAWNDDWDGNA
ncbi:hypothetical protein [Azospirillum argentinense]|uniref:hypothetical protein n=1 Tax=Azospirillum argentinense TaxID=2970906 RepID=UPI0032DEA40C